MDSVEILAKNVASATEEALKSLNAALDDVIVTVLDEGTKGGLFGIGARPAKVLVRRKLDPVVAASAFLREVMLSMGLSVKIESSKKERHVYINLIGDNMGLLIGKRGKTLDALQYLTNLVINRSGVPEVSIILDTENYRKRRRETLESLAGGLARKVKSTKKNVVLEPMSRFERHIIHMALQNDRYVKTHSEGNEPYRNVVISPK
jgi:spoIIIJ-associated protein